MINVIKLTIQIPHREEEKIQIGLENYVYEDTEIKDFKDNLLAEKTTDRHIQYWFVKTDNTIYIVSDKGEKKTQKATRKNFRSKGIAIRKKLSGEEFFDQITQFTEFHSTNQTTEADNKISPELNMLKFWNQVVQEGAFGFNLNLVIIPKEMFIEFLGYKKGKEPQNIFMEFLKYKNLADTEDEEPTETRTMRP